MANEEYVNSILKWRQEIDTNLRRENGWLALAGLFWLRKGENLIGSDPKCDILLPARAPERLGTFEFDGNNVTLTVEANMPVEVNGMATKTALLDADQEDVPSFITFNDMRWLLCAVQKALVFVCGTIQGKSVKLFLPASGILSKKKCAFPPHLPAMKFPKL